MKKLLLPIESDRYPQELLDFVAVMHPLSPLMVTAAILPVADYASLAGNFHDTGVGWEDEEARARTVHYQSRELARFCARFDIQVSIHVDNEDFALPCLVSESRFSDLLLLNGQLSFELKEKDQPNTWMRDLLHRSECPVLLLPEKPALPGELLLAYDGSADSVFAIRQFAYLFPELSNIQATLIYINDEKNAAIPNEREIREQCSLHFTRFRTETLQIKDEEFHHSWIGKRNAPWLITGSFGRSAISEAWSHSFSATPIWAHRMPVFIAHR